MHLSTYMKKHKLHDELVAKAINRSRPTVSRIRRGKSQPHWKTILALKKWSKGKITADDFVVSAE